MPYCMYLRKSRADSEIEYTTDDQVTETLERHRKALLTLSEKMNLPIAVIYKEVVSGESIAARPEVQKLLHEVEEGKWEGVFVMEVERLARGDSIDQGIVLRAFKSHGTKIITPAKIYDPNDEFDEEYFEFGLFMSRREYKTIRRRMERGRIASVKEGKFISSVPPYGYTKTTAPDGKGFVLVPEPSEAPVVQRIYSLYLAGEGSTVIAQKLSDEGIATRTGTVWSPSSIRDILKNPVYAGYIRWGFKKETKETVDGKMTKKRTKGAECLKNQGKHEALVTQDSFDKVQKIMQINNKNTTRHDRTLQNPLAGLVYCRECGKLMSRVGANTHLPYATITCKGYKCTTVASPLDLVENKVMDLLQDYYENYELHFNTKTDKSATKISNSTIKKLKNRQITIDKQIEKTYNLLESGVYTVEVFTQRQQKLSEEKAEIEHQIERITEESLKEENKKPPTKGELESVLKLYKNCDTAEAKNKLLKKIIKRIEYSKETANTRGKRNNCNFTVDVYLNLQ